MHGPLVSLVMPIYRNKPEHLRTSLSAILGQSYDNLEIVLIVDLTENDSDSSIIAAIDAFRDDHRIRTLTRKGKQGYSSALNTGIRRSSGEFIARLDGDDYCDSRRIEKEMEVLVSSKTILTGTWARVVDEGNREIGRIRTPVSEKSVRDLIMLHNPFVHSSIVVARRVLEEVGLYNEAFEGAEDYELYLRLVSKGHSCINIPQFLTSLRETEGSITRGSRWRRTRSSYIRAKYEGMTRLNYKRPTDLFFALATPVSILVTPGIGVHLKRAIGWYASEDSADHCKGT